MSAAGRKRRQKWGQHFLADPAAVEAIVRMADPRPDDRVVEIGAGTGVLTRALAGRVGEVMAFEIDPALAQALEAASLPRVRVVCADFLLYDIPSIHGRFKVLGNLPFESATAILARLVPSYASIERMVLTFQKEVAERICAQPGSRDYGYLTLLVRYRFDASLYLEIPPAAFHPTPRVTSAVVVFTPAKEGERHAEDEAMFLRLLEASFRHKRKTLRNNLHRVGFLGMGEREGTRLLGALGLGPSARAEDLPLETFIDLATALAKTRRQERGR